MTQYSFVKFNGKWFVLSLFAALSFAGANKLCSSSIASSTIYFVPHVKNYCPSSKPCQKFRREVNLQGSGTLNGNRILTHSGKVISMGDCDTAFGASGKCLIPFISVAADPKYYSMGDIIQMPSMKGKRLSLPNGKTMIHPGYFIVQDTGGAIRGPNRFDFFTGSYGALHANNAFGAKGNSSTRLLDKDDCSPKKQFSVVRRGSISYESSLASIEEALRDSAGYKVAKAIRLNPSKGVQ